MIALARMLAAEAVGTFILTFVAVGGDVVDAVSNGTVGHVGRYLAPGFVVTAMIYSLSGVSGAHINPAVTLAFVLRRTISPRRAACYVLAQLLGATVAAWSVGTLLHASVAAGMSHTRVGASPAAVAGWEAVLTLILVFVILSTADEYALVGKNAAIAIGLTVAACGLFSSPVSGASMNPARSFGPAIVAGDLGMLWAYIAGPCIGAALAVGIVRVLHGRAPIPERRAANGAT